MVFEFTTKKANVPIWGETETKVSAIVFTNEICQIQSKHKKPN